MNIKIKRVYEEPDPKDGIRILVDRLWPRGLTKEKADIDIWLKEIAPSNALRQWFSHEEEKWDEFKKRYHQELNNKGEQIAIIKDESKKGVVTLVYGAKDEHHNQALALQEFFKTPLIL